VLFVGLKRATMREKKVWGRKRHLLVDTQGHLLAVTVTGAHRTDQQGAKRLLEPLADGFPKIQVLWGDSHYGGSLIGWIQVHLGWTVQTVRALPLPEPGFRLLPRRWIVERSFAWITRWRRLARDHEGLPESSEAFIQLSASRRMLSLLAPPFP
jgi:transposase